MGGKTREYILLSIQNPNPNPNPNVTLTLTVILTLTLTPEFMSGEFDNLRLAPAFLDIAGVGGNSDWMATWANAISRFSLERHDSWHCMHVSYILDFITNLSMPTSMMCMGSGHVCLRCH